MNEPESENDIATETEENVQVEEPQMYKVLLLNDDYTPMDFVTWLLQTVFHKPIEESIQIMLQVHRQGSGLCGIYPYEVARTKVKQVQEVSKKHEHPLQCIMEAEGNGGNKPC